MPLKLICLNVEKSYHLDTVISFLKSESADIICMQEVMEKDFEKYKEAANMNGFFLPTYKNNPELFPELKDEIEGMAILTNLPNHGITSKYFRGKQIVEYIDPRTISRGVIASKFEFEEKEFIIGTTHYTWTPDGEIDEGQIKDFESLMNFVKQFDSFVLCGDFNAPRGREMFSKFTEYFKDNLPTEIESTIDENIHKKKGLRLVVDNVFSTPEYLVSNVRVIDGISDHKAIICEIDKN